MEKDHEQEFVVLHDGKELKRFPTYNEAYAFMGEKNIREKQSLIW